MKSFFFYLFLFSTCVLLIMTAWYEELQFVTIMCGIFAIIYQTNE